MEQHQPFSPTSPECRTAHWAVHDTLDVVNGKWRLLILGVLLQDKQQFRDPEISCYFLRCPFRNIAKTQLKQCPTTPISIRLIYSQLSNSRLNAGPSHTD